MARRSALRSQGMTATEFLHHDTGEGRAELVRGEVQWTPPPGGRHGRTVLVLVRHLDPFVERHRLGSLFVDAGFELIELPRTVRAPDIAFVRAGRALVVTDGFVRGAPDLAIEVLSSSETASRLREKLEDYAVSGVSLVWVVDPRGRTVRVIERGLPERVLSVADVLEGGELLPGLTLPLDGLFAAVG
jgi:Uma2 family endonuclease